MFGPLLDWLQYSPTSQLSVSSGSMRWQSTPFSSAFVRTAKGTTESQSLTSWAKVWWSTWKTAQKPWRPWKKGRVKMLWSQQIKTYIKAFPLQTGLILWNGDWFLSEEPPVITQFNANFILNYIFLLFGNNKKVIHEQIIVVLFALMRVPL